LIRKTQHSVSGRIWSIVNTRMPAIAGKRIPIKKTKKRPNQEEGELKEKRSNCRREFVA